MPAIAIPATPSSIPVLATGPPTLLEFLDPLSCDDVVVEPWTAQELRFRIRRILAGVRWTCDEGVLLLTHGRLIAQSCDGVTEAASLTGAEERFMRILCRGIAVVVPRPVLAHLAGSMTASRSVDMQISRLRRKLSRVTGGWGRTVTIRAVRGHGYTISMV